MADVGIYGHFAYGNLGRGVSRVAWTEQQVIFSNMVRIVGTRDRASRPVEIVSKQRQILPQVQQQVGLCFGSNLLG